MPQVTADVTADVTAVAAYAGVAPDRSSAPALVLIHARSFAARLTGLLSRPPLLPGQALLLRPCASVHTCFMRYAIDVVYLDRHECILKVVAALAPWRLSVCLGARATLELAAGEAARLSLRPGGRVDLG